MDALELPEKNAVPYRSRRPGMMHACGHDGHVAGLLGVAAMLMQLRDRLPGNVKLLFQPGEEGAGGAERMIRDGVLEAPKLVAIASLHVGMDYEAGKIGIGPGYLTAQVDDLDLTITGKTGHAARPDEGVDAIGIASQVLIALQQFVGRHTNPLDRRVISIGMVNGGTRRNIVADAVTLSGTVRTLEPETREKIMTFLTRDLRKLVGAMGGGLRVKIDPGYPPSYNEERVTEIVEAAGADVVGKQNVVPRTRPGLGGEDFAYFGQAGLPAAMLELGIRDEKKGFTAPGHSSRFEFDDRRVLPIGAAVLTDVAFRMLEQF
jgi:amidohydrolase